MGIELRLLSSSGSEVATLPNTESLQISPVYCDAGAMKFNYPKNGVNFSQLEALDEFRVATYIDGVRQGKLDGLINEIGLDRAEDTGIWTFNGVLANGQLRDAVVYPKGWPTVNPLDTKQNFLNVTGGALVATLMQQAQARGTLTGITYNSFSSTTDSNGVAWPTQIDIEYAPGVNYLDLLKALRGSGLCEFQMVSNDLRLYVIDSMGVDRTTGSTPIVLRRGRDMKDNPRKSSAKEIATVILAGGAEGVYIERSDGTEIAARRRIETSSTQGQVKDLGTLQVFSDTELGRIKKAKVESTVGTASWADDTTPRAIRDFDIGDWVFADTTGTPERLRVKQWALTQSNSGEIEQAIVLNDFFMDQQEVLSEKIKGIIGGSTITGGSVAEPVDQGTDTLSPSTPSQPSLSSLAYTDPSGQIYAQVSVSWPQVTTNTDTTALQDFSHYEARWRYQTDSANYYQYIGNISGTFVSFSPVTPLANIDVQVRAVDTNGNVSGWSLLASITAANDTTPPPVPAAPVGDNYLGLLRWRWTGWVSGGVTPSDLKAVEFHVSTVNNFTPDRSTTSTTLIGTAISYPSYFFSEGVYDTTYYCKLVAVDRNGNVSAASAQGSAVASQVVGTDLDGNIVNLEHITFKDQDNLVDDGNFAVTSLTTTRLAEANGTGSGWSAVTGEDPTSQAIRVGPRTGAATGFFPLSKDVPLIPGDQIMCRYRWASSAGTNTSARVAIGAVWTYRDGTESAILALNAGPAPTGSATAWQNHIAYYVTVPDNVVKARFFLRNDFAAVTAGAIDIDAVEIRRVTGTSLIRDAAISTAKINDLAVNTAKISDLSVGKLTAGTLAADIVLGARIATALTGARTEMNSSGFYRYDSGGNIMVQIDATQNLLTGIFKTAASGRRIEIGAGGNLGSVQFIGPGGETGQVRTFTASYPVAGIEAIQLKLDSTENIYSAWNAITVQEDEAIVMASEKVQITYGGNRAGTAAKEFTVWESVDRGLNSPNTFWDADVVMKLSNGTGFETFTTNTRRLWVNASTVETNVTTSTNFFINGKGRFLFDIPNGARMYDDSNNLRFWVGLNSTTFRQGPTSSTGVLDIVAGKLPGYFVTPGLKFTTPQQNGQGGVYTALWQYSLNYDATNQGLEARNGADTAFIPIKAASFSVQSDMIAKTSITDAVMPALEIVNGLKVKKWRRKIDDLRPRKVKYKSVDDIVPTDEIQLDDGIDRSVEIEPREEMGPIAQDLPAELQITHTDGTLGYSLHEYTALLHIAIQQLAAEVADLRKVKS